MPNLSELKQETYLGDGLYASFNEYGIQLRAPRDNGDHWVALDLYDVLPAFLAYVDDLKVKLSQHLKDQPQPNLEPGYGGPFRWEIINSVPTLMIGPFPMEEK